MGVFNPGRTVPGEVADANRGDADARRAPEAPGPAAVAHFLRETSHRVLGDAAHAKTQLRVGPGTVAGNHERDARGGGGVTFL